MPLNEGHAEGLAEGTPRSRGAGAGFRRQKRTIWEGPAAPTRAYAEGPAYLKGCTENGLSPHYFDILFVIPIKTWTLRIIRCWSALRR